MLQSEIYMFEKLKKYMWALIGSIAFIVFGFGLQWTLGGKEGQAIGGVLILIGILVASYSVFSILKK